MECTIDTASDAALKGMSLHNSHLTITKELKLLMILFKKKEKKDMAPLSIKRFGIPVVPLLDPVHLSQSIPEHTFRGLRVMTKEIYFQKEAVKYLSRLGNNILQKKF